MHRMSDGVRLLLLALAVCVVLPARHAPAQGKLSAQEEASARQAIERYVRAKHGVPRMVKITVWPLLDSGNVNFYQTTVTLEKDNQRKNYGGFLSRDLRYLILGDSYPLGSDPRADIAKRVQELAKLPATALPEVGEFRPANVPHLLVTRVVVEAGSDKQSYDLFLTDDKALLLVGEIGDVTRDPIAANRRAISLQNSPSEGPARAPVTIVEFSDLECPSCAAFHEFLVKELLPKYAGKVRVVFKEYPLAKIHPWTMTASIADQCAYRLDPAAYVRFRSLIFRQQNDINPGNVRERVLSLGEEAGVDRMKLAACVDSKATLPQINKDLEEGQAVGVHSTPTTFINGRMVVGMLPPNEYYRVVNEALAAATHASK